MRLVQAPLVIVLCLATAHAGSAQTPPPATQTTPPAQTTQTQSPPPDSLERIRAAVNRPQTLKLEDGHLRIYVEVIAKWPTFVEATRGYDLMNGPTGLGNPMSHQEFVNMMTPQDLYGSGGIQASEVLTMAVVNYFGQKLIKKGLKQIGEARTDKEIREIRARIDAELAALRGGK